MSRGSVAFLAGLLMLATAAAAATAAPARALDWTSFETANITHQGGEAEAPSNTMYAYERSMRLGADMLEIDIHTTLDNEVIVLHDATVDRTTNGSGEVYGMTLAEVQALDAGYNLVPGEGTRSGRDRAEYPFRGVRTGARKPPRGFKPNDFRIPTLREVMEEYPDVPINIEIKGKADTNIASFLHNAELLAAELTEIGRTEGIIVASFNDAALNYFNLLAPEIDLAPALAETAVSRVLTMPVLPRRVALQVPITFNGLQVTNQNWVDQAQAGGYAVHVWLSNDPENDDVYNTLVAWGVEGIMAAEPAALERFLCANGVPRPRRPAGLPGAHCRQRQASIACDARPRLKRKISARGRIKVTLRRRDEFEGRCAGRLELRAGGRNAGRERFVFGRVPPSEGGRKTVTVKTHLSRKAMKRLRRGAKLKLTARPHLGFPRSRKVAIG